MSGKTIDHHSTGKDQTLTIYYFRFIKHLQDCGFAKERQVSLPHKQSWYVRQQRETWESPAL